MFFFVADIVKKGWIFGKKQKKERFPAGPQRGNGKMGRLEAAGPHLVPRSCPKRVKAYIAQV